jgi:hypothetical protein
VADYAAYGFVTAESYARSRAWGLTLRRDQELWKYRGAMISCILLSMALIFFFGPGRGR